jgi:glycine dehydrogenase subunit 1
MTCKQKHVRQMPGRIVGRTVDLDGNPGFALTL